MTVYAYLNVYVLCSYLYYKGWKYNSKPVIRFSDTSHYKSLQACFLRKASITMFCNGHFKASREKP